MEIIYKNYTAKETDGKFDLIETKTIVAQTDNLKCKKGESYTTESVVAYGITFERLLERLVQLEISKESQITITAYIERFKEIKEEITNALN